MKHGTAVINGYNVSIGPEGVSCACKDFLYRRKDAGEYCKHLKQLEQSLRVEGVEK